MQKRLRFNDLRDLGIVGNRVTLKHWIRAQGFPPGQLTGPNSRTWGEDDVRAWLASRPTAPKPAQALTELNRLGRPRKSREPVDTTATRIA